MTKRETEVVVAWIAGKSDKTIGRELNISYRTVQVHRRRAGIKLGGGNRMQLIIAAHTAGIVDFNALVAGRAALPEQRREGVPDRLHDRSSVQSQRSEGHRDYSEATCAHQP